MPILYFILIVVFSTTKQPVLGRALDVDGGARLLAGPVPDDQRVLPAVLGNHVEDVQRCKAKVLAEHKSVGLHQRLPVDEPLVGQGVVVRGSVLYLQVDVVALCDFQPAAQGLREEGGVFLQQFFSF